MELAATLRAIARGIRKSNPSSDIAAIATEIEVVARIVLEHDPVDLLETLNQYAAVNDDPPLNREPY